MNLNKLCIMLGVLGIIILLSSCNEKVTTETHHPNSLAPATSKATLSDEDFIKRYNYWVKKYHFDKGFDHIMQRAREFNKEGKKIHPFYYDWFRDELRIEKEKGYWGGMKIRISKQGIYMSFNESGELINIHNDLARDARAIYIWEGAGRNGMTAQKTKEKIIKQAEPYLNELLGNMKTKYSVGQPKAKFNRDSGWLGTWLIVWPRIMNGYEVPNDNISIRIDEEYGFCGFIFEFYSENCSTDIKISKEEAEKIALPLAQKVIDGTSWLYPKDYRAKVQAQLKIVSPNYIFKQSKPYETLKTRLAYRVLLVDWTKDESEKEMFYIDVDAATGEILGGDYPQ